MNDLIDRYIHQVGLYVRPADRAEIEDELRSQIYDRLEDRFPGTPSTAQIAQVLQQLGDPHVLAASYSGEVSLVGPALYPFLIAVLRIGLPLVPVVVVIVNIASALLAPQGGDWVSLVIGSVVTAVQAALIFFAVVVLFFTLLQQSGDYPGGPSGKKPKPAFDPLHLPPVDDPASVDRFETGFGIAIGTLIGVALLYFALVGGLTLRFNLNDPGEVLPVPLTWLLVLASTTFGGVLLNVWMLLRARWTPPVLLLQTAFEVVGSLGLYFVFFRPLANLLLPDAPQGLPVIMTLGLVILIVLAGGVRMVRIWQHRQP